MREPVHFYVGELPPGFTNEKRLQAHGSLKSMGRQDSRYPELKTRIRPNFIEYDEEGILVSMGTEWIVSGGFFEEELELDFISEIMATALGMTVPAIKNNITYQLFDSLAELQLFIAENSANFRERLIT